MNKTNTGLVAFCLAIAGAPAAAQTSPSGGIGTLAPPPVSTTQGSDQAQNPPGGERGGERQCDEKSPRASH
jgi:hypothetical protein